jgi:hypothetical protein
MSQEGLRKSADVRPQILTEGLMVIRHSEKMQKHDPLTTELEWVVSAIETVARDY